MAGIKITRICEQCGQAFPLQPNTVGRFCAYACYWKSKIQPKPDLFWKRVQKSDGCWLWQGRANNNGYGNFETSRYFRCLAHRFSYELAYGPIPDGQIIRHKCDTPRCVRPDHLQSGTQLDNMRDACAKGRQAKGERQGAAKLTEAAVKEARLLYATGTVTYEQLGHRYQVDRQVISKAIRGLTWRHIP